MFGDLARDIGEPEMLWLIGVLLTSPLTVKMRPAALTVLKPRS